MAGGWSSLPADLLKEISTRLTADADHLHARQVCAHWRASTSPLSACRPWVLAGRRGPSVLQLIGEHSFRLLRDVRHVDMAADPPPGLRYCRGASRGWLVLSDDLSSPTRLVLWDPLSGAEIPLPRLCPVTQVFLSGDPLASSHWIAVATQRRGTIWATYAIFFWRPGDTAWSELHPRMKKLRSAIGSVEFHAGKMYFITDDSYIFIYDLNLGTTSAPARLHFSRLPWGWWSRANGKQFHSLRVVACGGQILIVLLFGSLRPSHIEVYTSFATPTWPLHFGDRVTDLAGHSLFLGCNVFALPATGFPAIKGNRIYYMADCLEVEDTVLGLVFDLETDAVEEIPCPRPREEDGSIDWSPYSWFCPRKPFLTKEDEV